MDLQAIYIKTEKGLEELATRAYKVPSRVRNLLVMVDGTATGEQIVETTAVLGNSAAFFSLLVDEGFIAPLTSASPTATTAAVEIAPSKELVREVCHMVSELLGPGADSLTIRMEKARSIEEFAKLVEQSRDVIGDMVGKKKAEQFWNAVAGKLPA